MSVFLHALAILFGTLISSLAQVLLKKSAQREYASKWQEYMNPRVIFAYAIFFGATLFGVLAYRGIPLSMGAVLEASGYVYVTIFGVKFFGERVGRRKLAGLALIFAGIAVYSFLG